MMTAQPRRMATEPVVDPDTGQPLSDPFVVVGAVPGSPSTTGPRANIVCREEGGRLVWYLLRFSAITGGNYQFRPSDRPHGFSEGAFADQFPYIVRPRPHVWRLTQVPLTPDVVVALLNEVINAS